MNQCWLFYVLFYTSYSDTVAVLLSLADMENLIVSACDDIE